MLPSLFLWKDHIASVGNSFYREISVMSGRVTQWEQEVYLQLNYGIKLHLTGCSWKLAFQLGTYPQFSRNSVLTSVLLQNSMLDLAEMCYLHHMSCVALLWHFVEERSVQTVKKEYITYKWDNVITLPYHFLNILWTRYKAYSWHSCYVYLRTGI